jgi:hypothetical protein
VGVDGYGTNMRKVWCESESCVRILYESEEGCENTEASVMGSSERKTIGTQSHPHVLSE